jgi:bifunctional UDP-N-acetylglucosamine pyrophosphorylase/glucosamine-1-phosphate N-acetyltransferase
MHAPMTSTSAISVVILAAGVGSRMRSAVPKPLHEVGGRALLGHALDAAACLGGDATVVVVGPGAPGERVAEAAGRFRPGVAIAIQDHPRGTGDALRRALVHAGDGPGDLLALYADTPFVRSATLQAMRAARAAGAGVVVLGFEAADPRGYGRLILGTDGALERIVEDSDASPAERSVRLCNAGIMMLDRAAAPGWLAALGADNARGEVYLTDVVALARAGGVRCAVVACAENETMGVNDRAGLAAAEAAFQAEARRRALEAGAAMTAPETVFLSWDTHLEPDVIVEPNVVFGLGVRVASGARIRAFSHLEGCLVASGAVVGPFARLRPGAEIGLGAHVGNFVEVKNAVLGAAAKANHLAYLGDAAIGEGANIGAGAITCNYDGAAKHRTEIGKGAFVGSNAALVAPVRIGAGAYVASGSVVTEDVPADALAIGRARQQNKLGLAARLRVRFAALAAARL